MADHAAEAVLDAARRLARETGAPLLLAVSGGLDSMTLLSAVLRVASDRVAGVATFDHGTGAFATRAAKHVTSVARAAGVRVIRGRLDARSPMPDGREAGWRMARYRFLRAVAKEAGALVVTAHSMDDQVETVLMRVMRGSGARGLAGLYARSDLLRPFLGVRRHDLERYARVERVAWVEDPSNASPQFARNRIRHDILPALRRVDPAIDEAMLSLAASAAEWRTHIDALVDVALEPTVHRGQVIVASKKLADYDRVAVPILWSSLAARVGLALDHRGTRRVAEFTMKGPRTGSIPLAGGWSVEATRDVYILGRSGGCAKQPPAVLPVNEQGCLEWGRFRFRLTSPARATADALSPWSAWICAESDGLVRAWNAGDRLEPAGGQPRRRVTRYLSDVGVHGRDRAGWPVVIAGEDVVWIPGVRRSDAATDRSGRPVRHYICERIDR